jgi:hypothetical protein
MNPQASRPGNGRALRRARNIVKRLEYFRVSGGKVLPDGSVVAIGALERHRRKAVLQKRYERACALILAQKLSE